MSDVQIDRRPYETATVRFLTGSQHLYGSETLKQVAAQSAELVDVLNADPAMPVRIEWQPVLADADAIERACRDASSDPSCVGVIAWMHTFSPAKMWIRGLTALDVPLLHLHTQANERVPWETLDMDFMNLNQAAHGDREFGYIETRLGIGRETVVGHVSDVGVRERIGRWMRVTVARAALHGMRLARIGDNMRGVAVTEGDKVEAERRFGTSVNTYSVNEVVELVDAVEETQVDELISTYLQEYDVAPELRAGGDRHGALRQGARIEAGLRSFLKEGGFEAFTTNFEDLGGLRQLPGLAVQRLMAEGYGFGAEGDWKTAILLRAVKVMGAGLPGGTSFMEDYVYDFGAGTERIIGAHMLEVCPTIAGRRPTLEIHPLGIGDRDDPVRLRFTAAPGHGIVVGISDLGNRFRLLTNMIELVEPDHPLPRLPVGCAVWRPLPSLPVSAECWLTAGGPHHTVLSAAIDQSMIEMFAVMTGTDFALIDEQTTPREFAAGLRLNDLYYLLASR